ncbi:MAG: hypothetical protein B6241_02460 [Spirochaetaceae bacterium 4572_59]|nr:MAG: hypothetical protein B6241_02460 [Spirochaetaceae bacterium 4572_59]
MVKAVRGAISLDADNQIELKDKVRTLYLNLQELNGFSEESIVSIIFSQTHDISYNPAKALRISVNISTVPLFCTQEPACIDFPQEMMLRVLITYNAEDGSGPAVPVYLGKALELRADLTKR